MAECEKGGGRRVDPMHTGCRGRFTHRLLLTGLMAAVTLHCPGYSLLTHEELVDILWQDQIEPLLLKRFPAATAAQLTEAHAYAYGGCLIQDIGYYPFGNQFFSELMHYVRTGDFVTNLIRESADLDQYAFALGALEHYSADCTGHPFINRAVALEFPRLRARFGDNITFEDGPTAHLQTEFGFDTAQVAKHRYSSDQYRSFIGFEVSQPVLERAFMDTYGIRLRDVLPLERLAVGTFRHAVSQVIPEMTQAALTVYHPELVEDKRDSREERFLFNLSRAEYERQWGSDYRKPGWFSRMLGWVVRWVPKVGVLKGLAVRIPTPDAESLYVQSVNRTVDEYGALLQKAGHGSPELPNLNCDTGQPIRLGEYALADSAHARLLEILFQRGFERVPPDLRQSLLRFYDQPSPPLERRRARKAWDRTWWEVVALRSGPGSAAEAEIRSRLLGPLPRLESPKARGEHLESAT